MFQREKRHHWRNVCSPQRVTLQIYNFLFPFELFAAAKSEDGWVRGEAAGGGVGGADKDTLSSDTKGCERWGLAWGGRGGRKRTERTSDQGQR